MNWCVADQTLEKLENRFDKYIISIYYKVCTTTEKSMSKSEPTLHLVARKARTSYTVAEFATFLNEAEEIAVLPLEIALVRAREIVVAIPQNLLMYFKTKLWDHEKEFHYSVFAWLQSSIRARMAELNLLPTPYKT